MRTLEANRIHNKNFVLKNSFSSPLRFRLILGHNPVIRGPKWPLFRPCFRGPPQEPPRVKEPANSALFESLSAWACARTPQIPLLVLIPDFTNKRPKRTLKKSRLRTSLMAWGHGACRPKDRVYRHAAHGTSSSFGLCWPLPPLSGCWLMRSGRERKHARERGLAHAQNDQVAQSP